MADRRSLPPHEDELSLALLRSAEHDEPSAAGYAKVATALGVSAAVGLSASLPALASSGVSGSAAARWSGWLLGKGAVVGLSSVLLAVGGAALFAHRSHAPSRAATNAPLAAHLASLAPKSAPAATVPLQLAPPVEALASAVPAPTPPPDLVASAAPAERKSLLSHNAVRNLRPAKSSSLPQQVLSLDRARVALNSGDAGAALAEIAHYRSAWPRGVFLTEASVLEIQALAKRGEVVLAGMRAQAFVTAHPDSPQAERLRALIPSDAR